MKSVGVDAGSGAQVFEHDGRFYRENTAFKDIEMVEATASQRALTKNPGQPTAAALGAMDWKIWKKNGWRSGSEVSTHWAEYLQQVEASFKALFGSAKVSEKVCLKLEDDNQHSLNEALGQLGLLDKQATAAFKPIKPRGTPLYNPGGESNLVSVDGEQVRLDALEAMMLKQMGGLNGVLADSRKLRAIFNMTEGDFSQVSSGLLHFAEAHKWDEGFDMTIAEARKGGYL